MLLFSKLTAEKAFAIIDNPSSTDKQIKKVYVALSKGLANNNSVHTLRLGCFLRGHQIYCASLNHLINVTFQLAFNQDEAKMRQMLTSDLLRANLNNMASQNGDSYFLLALQLYVEAFCTKKANHVAIKQYKSQIESINNKHLNKSYQMFAHRIKGEQIDKDELYKSFKLYFGSGSFEKNYPALQKFIDKNKIVVKQFSKSKYEGTVNEQNQMHGKGTYTWESGAYYKGDFVNDCFEGHGEKHFTDGTSYVGEWKKDKYHGRGKINFKDGSYYDGEWCEGKRHGHGKYVWASGTTYEGAFTDGKISGYGKKTFDNGDVVEGEFTDGKVSGFGKYTWKDGAYYEGDFVDGNFCGKGVWHFDNGAFYVGEVKDDKFNGFGTYTHVSGTTDTGLYIDDQLHGVMLKTYTDNTKSVCLYKNGDLLDCRYQWSQPFDVHKYKFVDPNKVISLDYVLPYHKDSTLNSFECFMSRVLEPDKYDVPTYLREMEYVVREFQGWYNLGELYFKKSKVSIEYLGSLHEFCTILLGGESLSNVQQVELVRSDTFVEYMSKVLKSVAPTWKTLSSSIRIYAGYLLWCSFVHSKRLDENDDYGNLAKMNGLVLSGRRQLKLTDFYDNAQAYTTMYLQRTYYRTDAKPCQQSSNWDNCKAVESLQELIGTSYDNDDQLGHYQYVLHANGLLYKPLEKEYVK